MGEIGTPLVDLATDSGASINGAHLWYPRRVQAQSKMSGMSNTGRISCFTGYISSQPPTAGAASVYFVSALGTFRLKQISLVIHYALHCLLGKWLSQSNKENNPSEAR